MNRRSMPSSDAPPEWSEVSRREPCPCCGATSGCSIAADAQFVRCLTMVSDRPVATGGWLHPIDARRGALAAV